MLKAELHLRTYALLLSLGIAGSCFAPARDAPSVGGPHAIEVAGTTATAKPPSSDGAAGAVPGMVVMRQAGAGAPAANGGASGAAGVPAAGGGAGSGASGTTTGTAGNAGVTGSGGMVAGAGSAAVGGAPSKIGPNEDECGPIPTLPARGTMAGRVRGAGTIEYDIKPPNEWLSLRTTMLVPDQPPEGGTVFLWPGIQPLPSGVNYQPIGNGVLQPVLTWGPSCAPGAPSGHSSWWISPVYVNVSARDTSYRGCKGGKVIEVTPDNLLEMAIRLDAGKWVQDVLDLKTMKATEFAIDLKGQAQGRAFFVIELPSNAKPTEDVIFKRSVLTMAMPEPSACEPILRGMGDFASKARVSADGKHCCIDHITLRAAGVMATTMDP